MPENASSVEQIRSALFGADSEFDNGEFAAPERFEDEAATIPEFRYSWQELRALIASLFRSQEEERRRVARELHDGVSQKLALLEIDAQQAEPKIFSHPSQARREMERLRIAIGALSEEIHRISHALYPTVIEDLGITPAIRSLVEEFGEREEMDVTFRAENVPGIVSMEIAIGLYRIAQEALRNVARHAGKTRVEVLLNGELGRLRLQILDAGPGFDPRSRGAGLGLIRMEERTRIMRGTLGVDSQLGHGTRVTIDVPAG